MYWRCKCSACSSVVWWVSHETNRGGGQGERDRGRGTGGGGGGGGQRGQDVGFTHHESLIWVGGMVHMLWLTSEQPFLTSPSLPPPSLPPQNTFAPFFSELQYYAASDCQCILYMCMRSKDKYVQTSIKSHLLSLSLSLSLTHMHKHRSRWAYSQTQQMLAPSSFPSSVWPVAMSVRC